MPAQNIRGGDLFYSDSEKAGTPLVLIHGFPLDSTIWDNQVSALSKHRRVITVDLPGFGRSISTAPFSIESLADDVHALLEKIGATPCALAGLSMGGYVALALVKKYPSDLAGLVLVDTKADADTPQAKQARNEMIELAWTQGSNAIADQMQPRMLAPDTLAHKPQIVRQLRQVMEKCPALTIQHALAAMRDREDFSPLLANLAMPVLVVVGEHDAITPPAGAEAMSRKITNAKRVVIAGAGHMSPIEEPGQVNEALRNFCDALG